MNSQQIPFSCTVEITRPQTVTDTTPELNLFHHEDYKKYKLPCPKHFVQQELVSNVPMAYLNYVYKRSIYIPYSDDVFDRVNRALESKIGRAHV